MDTSKLVGKSMKILGALLFWSLTFLELKKLPLHSMETRISPTSCEPRRSLDFLTAVNCLLRRLKMVFNTFCRLINTTISFHLLL